MPHDKVKYSCFQDDDDDDDDDDYYSKLVIRKWPRV